MYDVKYAPFADSYMGMAHGNGYEHLKHWLKRRLIFCDTLFDYAPSYNNDMLTIRANTTELMNIEIETYTPVYQHVSWYNGQMDKKKIDGKTAVSFSGTAMAETDQEVLIYGGSNIKKISGITSMNPNQMLIGGATRLSELSAPNCPLLADINSNKANLSPHTYLNKVDLSNCPQLGGILRLNNSQLVKDVNISGTTIDGLQLPTNVRNLETFKLSEDVVNVILRDAVLLKELNIPTNIEYLSLINVPSLTTITSNASSFEKLNTLIMENPTINPISNITSKAPNLQYVRLMGLNISCATSQIQSLLNMKGVDSFGNEIPISQAVSGKVTLSQCSEDIEQALKETFPLVEFIVSSYVKSYTVTFVDGDENTIYVTQTLENGEAIYIGDTPTKTSTAQYDFEWKGWDRQLKPITSDCIIRATFNDILRYYTIRFINSDTLEVVDSQYLAYGSTPTKPSIPSGFNAWSPTLMQTVTDNFDYYSKYLPYPEDLSMFTFSSITLDGIEGYECMLNASHEDSYFIIPFEHNGLPVLKYSQSDSSIYSRATEIYIPDNLIALGKHAFAKFSNIETFDLPNVKYFYSLGNTSQGRAGGQFRSCTALKYLYLPKIRVIPRPDANNETAIVVGCTNLELACIGSKEYPVTTFYGKFYNSDYVSNFNGSVSAGVGCINLVTANGVESDVAFNYMINTVKNVITYSTDTMRAYSDDDDFDYHIIGDDEAIITAYKGTATEIEIPSTVKGATVTKIGDNVFYNSSVNAKITSVSMPNTVTSLGNKCFYNCTNLTSIDLPLATNLGDYCFSDCKGLTSIDFPLVTTLGTYCFYNCSNLIEVNLPNATKLPVCCFYNCSELIEGYFDKATSMGGNCFYKCTKLKRLSFKSLQTIMQPDATYTGDSYKSPFNGCSALEYVWFGSKESPFHTWKEDPDISDTSDSYYQDSKHFCHSSKLVMVNVVTSDGTKATMSGSPYKDSVFVYSSESAEIYLDDSFEYRIIENEATIIAYNDTATEIEIPSTVKGATVTAIGKRVFRNSSVNAEITSVSMPNTVTSLELSCFNSCSNLTSINLSNVTSLGDYCFYNCTKLAEANLPLITSLGADCFRGCNGLTEINLPKVTSLGDRCFYSCTSLTSIDLPLATSLGSECFSICSSLTETNLPLVTSLGNRCIANCSSLTSIELPLATSLNEYCFEKCTKLASIGIPEAISLGENCFYGCTKLRTITLPKVKTLGNYLTNDCPTGITVILGGVGNPITDTSGFAKSSVYATTTTLIIYVTDPSNPPTLSGSPWGATNATITYEQA